MPIYTSNNAIVQIRNMSPDPTSVLRVTGLSVSGTTGFYLSGVPNLPADLPTDGTILSVVVNYFARTAGAGAGALTIDATNATNAPYAVPLAARTLVAAFLPETVMIDFDRGSIVQPAPEAGPLSDFQFTIPTLPGALEAENAIALRKLLPWFAGNSVHTTNAFGEDVLLDDMSRVYVVTLADGSDVGETVEGLRDEAGISSIGPDFLGTPLSVPNDRIFQDGLQWGLHNDGSIDGSAADVDINALEAWEHYIGLTSAVYIIDSGVDLDHEDLDVAAGYNAYSSSTPPDDDFHHGTGVAGIAGAIGNNDEGSDRSVVGVHWGAGPNLGAVKVTVPVSHEYPQSLAASGVDWVRQKPGRIANMSFGYQAWPDEFYRACRNAALGGVFLVAAMGNTAGQYSFYPAKFRHVVFSVGAIWLTGDIWQDSDLGIPGGQGSSTGSWIDVVAPRGHGIASTRIGGSYYDPMPAGPPNTWGGFGGTSAAAPFVSGTAALLQGFGGFEGAVFSLQGDDLGQILRRTARDLEQYGDGFDNESGYGLIRADAALDYVAWPKAVQHTQLAGLTDVEQEFVSMHKFYGAQGVSPTGQPFDLEDAASHNTIRHRMRGTFNFDPPFDTAPEVWFRTSGTIGWSDNEPYRFASDPPSCAVVVPSSLSATSAQFDTFILEVLESDGGTLGWFPVLRDDARIAVTAVGFPAGTVGVDRLAPLSVGAVIVAPNPGPGRTNFLMDLPGSGTTSLRIYDLAGRLLRVLDGAATTGQQTVPWDGLDHRGQEVAAGVYFWRLEKDGDKLVSDKLVIAR